MGRRAFGLAPGLLLDLVSGTVVATLNAVQPTAPYAVPTTVVIGLVLIVVVLVLARVGWVLLRPRGTAATLEPEGGAAH